MTWSSNSIDRPQVWEERVLQHLEHLTFTVKMSHHQTTNSLRAIYGAALQTPALFHPTGRRIHMTELQIPQRVVTQQQQSFKTKVLSLSIKTMRGGLRVKPKSEVSTAVSYRGEEGMAEIVTLYHLETTQGWKVWTFSIHTDNINKIVKTDLKQRWWPPTFNQHQPALYPGSSEGHKFVTRGTKISKYLE